VALRVGVSRRAFLTAAGAAAALGGGWLGADAWRRYRTEAAVLPWLKANAHGFDLDNPDSVWTPPLSRALAGARVIGLGEATHGSHDDAAVKSAIIKGLIRDGAIRTVLLEVNAPGGRELDAFIQGGSGSARDRLRTAKVFRVVKTEAVADLLDWLRQWNRTAAAPVRIFGIDCQATAEDAATAFSALRTVNPAEAERLAASLRPILSPQAQALRFPALIKSLTTAQLLEAMTALEAVRAALAKADASRDAIYAARTAWQGLKAFEMETSDGKVTGDAEAYYARRDGFMADNVLNAPMDGAAALWAHNNHVVAERFEGTTFLPTGAQLRRRLGDAYRAVVVEYGSARFNAVPASPFAAFPEATEPTAVISWDGTGGRPAGLLGKVREGSFWVSLRDMPDTEPARAWRRLPYSLDWPGYAAPRWQALSYGQSMPTASLYDVIVYAEALTPSRPV